MKSILLLTLGLCAIQASAETLTADLQNPISFKFSQDITLQTKIGGAPGTLSSYLRLEQEESPDDHIVPSKEVLHTKPGANPHFSSGCVLEKTDASISTSTIRGAANEGSDWTIQYTGTEKKPQDHLTASWETFLNGKLRFPLIKLENYTTTFQIKNSEGASLTLTCSSICNIPLGMNMLPDGTSRCESRLSSRVADTLKAMGINLPESVYKAYARKAPVAKAAERAASAASATGAE